MRKLQKKDINNVMHVLLMFSIMYLIGNINVSKFSEFILESKIIGIPLLGFIIGFTLGMVPERIQEKLQVGSFSLYDLLLYGIGGSLGGIVNMLYPEKLNFYCYVMIIIYISLGSFQVYKKYKN